MTGHVELAGHIRYQVNGIYVRAHLREHVNLGDRTLQECIEGAGGYIRDACAVLDRGSYGRDVLDLALLELDYY